MWSDQDRAFLRDRKEIQREEVTCPFSGKTKIWIPVDQPPHTTSFGCHQDCCLEICTWKVRRKYAFLFLWPALSDPPQPCSTLLPPCLEGSFCVSFKIYHQSHPCEAFPDTFNSALGFSAILCRWHGPLGQHLSKSTLCMRYLSHGSLLP